MSYLHKAVPIGVKAAAIPKPTTMTAALVKIESIIESIKDNPLWTALRCRENL